MRSRVHVVDHSIDAETGDDVLVGDPDVGDARRSEDRGNRLACAILVRSLHAHHSIDGCFECERLHGRGLPHASGLLLVAVTNAVFIALARKWFRPGRKMVSLVFRGERSGPALSPVVRGFFFGRPTVTATNRARIGQPMTHSTFSWLLGQLGGPPVVVLCTPQMGSQEASNKGRSDKSGGLFVRRDEPAASLLQPTAWGNYHDRADNESTENVRVSPKRRATKFAPENVQKIKDCVAQGLGREEIAKLLDVTVGSLQVTCSRLGISLRRPHMRYPSYDRLKTQLQLRMVEKGSRPQGKFAITTHRKDNVRAVDVPLSVEAIGQLGLYASLRDMGLVELIAQVLGEAVKKDLVGKILDDIPPKP